MAASGRGSKVRCQPEAEFEIVGKQVTRPFLALEPLIGGTGEVFGHRVRAFVVLSEMLNGCFRRMLVENGQRLVGFTALVDLFVAHGSLGRHYTGLPAVGSLVVRWLDGGHKHLKIDPFRARLIHDD